jgi:hypothetical protein
MQVPSVVAGLCRPVFALVVASALAGCAYGGLGPPQPHYLQFNAEAPHGNTVTVCSAYGCRHKSPFTFTHHDIATLTTLMAANRNQTATDERKAIAKAIAWIENRVGRENGTWKDRAGIDFSAAGDPTQMDCVDEATNTTSYLSVLAAHGLLNHHEVLSPMAKDGVGRWTHYFAIIREKASGQRWALDSSMRANGQEPIIMQAEKYYVNLS